MRTEAATEKRKKRRRHRHGMAFYAVPIALLMTIALVVLSYNLLKVETIQVEGTTRYQTGEILAASGLKTGDKMFKIKPSAVTEAIGQKLSYIGDVQLSFKLPSTVILTVSEAEVSCSVETENGYILLSDKMKILQTDSPMADVNVPIIKGLKPKDTKQGGVFTAEKVEDITVIQELFSALAEYTFPTVRLIDISDISNISLACENNNSILLGGPSQLTYKLEFVKEVLQSEESSETGGLIINAQPLDSKAHPNVSVLPSRNVYSEASSTPPGSSGEGDTDSSITKSGQAEESGGKSADVTKVQQGSEGNNLGSSSASSS